jgi:hypothetical protein
MNLFAEMFRSKASSADPLSPGHDERSTFEGSILLYRRIMTQPQRGRGKGADQALDRSKKKMLTMDYCSFI